MTFRLISLVPVSMVAPRERRKLYCHLPLSMLCGLPRTFDLADLTREIFDLALVGERSSRRTQLESLLLALSTPCQTPQEFLRGSESEDAVHPAIEAPLALHAATLGFEHPVTGEEMLFESELPEDLAQLREALASATSR